MSNSYDSKAIEVLSGLDPVKKRPGMYTDTNNPNHLIQEVLDNSIDEALSGHCSAIKVSLFKDGFIQIVDDGRGMPVDIHPEHKVSGVELIMCKLHAGAKFSGDEYNFMVVPVFLDPTSPTWCNSLALSPLLKEMLYSFESLLTFTSNSSERALTTETPTP